MLIRRIEQTFGSYGIEVLYTDDALRLSGLYSTHDGKNVIRTFAIVGYPAAVDDEIAARHASVVGTARRCSRSAGAGAAASHAERELSLRRVKPGDR